MKKIMICSIILLPMIILLILSLSGVIVSSSTYLYVESIEFANDEITLIKDSNDPVEGSVKINIFPKFAKNQGINYWSSDDSIVSVDESGNLVGYSLGETYVYASSKENETKTAVCKVIVTSNTVLSVTISNPIGVMYHNETYRFNASVYPEDADNPRLIWSSSNKSILSITADGVATTYSNSGVVTVSCRSEANENACHELTITVKKQVEGITIEDTSPVSIGTHTYSFPQITVHPASSEADIAYSSSNESIASVDKQGIVTFHKQGTVTITATEKNGAKVSKVITSTNGFIDDVVFESNIINVDYEANKEIDLKYIVSPLDADLTNLSISSSNTSIVKVLDNKAYIVGGGSCSLTCTYNTGVVSVKTVKCTINVKRDTEKVAFFNSYNEETNYIYSTNKSVEINAKPYPEDSNDKIVSYKLSDTTKASISNGVILFKNVDYAIVDLTVTTASGIESTATYVYLSNNVNPFAALKGSSFKSVDMPLSMYEQKIVIAPYIHSSGINKVEIKSSSGIVSINDGICTATNSGDDIITILVNDVVFSTISVKVNRRVEDISNIKLSSYLLDEDRQLTLEDGYVYTSAKTIKLSYDLLPSETYVKKATISFSSPLAKEENGNIVFVSPGKVQVTLKADSVTKSFCIESTNGLFDNSSSLISSLTLTKGDEKLIQELFTNISPLYADLLNVTVLSSDENVIKVSDNKVKAIHGGDAVLTVKYNTINGISSNQIVVHVNEMIESIEYNSYSYVLDETISLDDYYITLPSTANYNCDISYSLIEGNSISSIINDQLVFSDEGLVRVKVESGNGIEIVLSFIYTGSIEVIENLDGVIDIEINKEFIIKPSSSILNSATYEDEFIVSKDLEIGNGVILSIATPTPDKECNAICSFSGNEFKFRGIIKSTSITLSPLNPLDVDVISSSNYITSLKQLELTNTIIPSNATNNEYTYVSSSTNIAEVIDNVLIFKKAGEVYITSSNKDGNSSTIRIRSTYDEIQSISLSLSDIVKEYDNDNSSNNVYDLTSIISPYPSQIVVSKDNVKLVVNNNVATIDGLSIILNKGGDSRIDVLINNENIVVATINLHVDRKATSIILNDQDINEINSTILVHSSLYVMNTKAYTSDSTINKDIAYEIIDGESFASINGKQLIFTEINKDVKVKYTLGGNKEWIITYNTDSLTRSINIDDEIIVAPSNETFSFYSENGNVFSVNSISFALDTNGAGNYFSSIAQKGTISLNINSEEVVKDFIVTRRVYEITGVQIIDTFNESNTLINCLEGYNHLTASKEISISFDDILYSLNRNGNVEEIKIISSNNEITQVIDNKLIFNQPGTTLISLNVDGNDFYGEYLVSYSFTVYSSFNRADDFELTNPYPSGIVIDEVPSFNLTTSINATRPLYGNVEPVYTYLSSDENILSISDSGIVSILSTGTVTIYVSTISGNNVQITKTISLNIDKYIDEIKFINDSNIICQDVTKNSKYELKLQLLSNTNVNPTLLDVIYAIESGDATISSTGLITFNQEETKVTIKVSAQYGGAESVFVISKVPSSVNIININSSTNLIESKIGTTSIINPQFDTYVTYDLSSIGNVNIISSITNIFSGNTSSENIVSLSGVDQCIKLVITQDVESVNLSLSAKEDGYLTALGEDGLNLVDLYGAYFIPSTARNINGLEKITYTVKNITGEATCTEEGILTFTKAGIVEITFSAGDKFVTRTIESTLGYVKSISFYSEIENYFEYTDSSYSIDYSKLIVVPSDATKKYFFLSSSNDDVFEVLNNQLIFTGGGNANIILAYYINANEFSTTSKAIFVNNRATKVETLHNDDIVNYFVSNNSFVIKTKVSYSGKKLSQYSISYESMDTSIANVDTSGLVSFVQKDKIVIVRVKVINQYDSNVDCYVDVFIKGTDKIIKEVKENTSISIEYDDINDSIIYPITPNYNSNFQYEILDGSSYVVLSNDTMSAIDGGYATIKIKDNDSFDKTVNIFVHRKVESINTDNTELNSDLITSTSIHDISPYIMPVSSRHEKTIVYEYDNSIATIENGIITFKKAGSISIKIKAVYKDVIECTKIINIQYTDGEVISFDVKQNGNSLVSSYDISNVGSSIDFTISNIVPSDYDGDYDVTTNNSEALSVSKSGSTITVKGISKGKGTITFSIGNVKYYTQINVLLKSSSVVVKYEGKEIDSINTMSDSFSVSSQVYPLNATDLSYSYSINGGAVVSQDGTISLSGCSYGVYTLTVTSNDGASHKDITINYVSDITGFNILHNDKKLISDETIRLNWNVQDAVVVISALNDMVGVDYSLFTLSSLNGSTFIRNGNVITVQTVSTSTSPNFSDVITISYKNIATFSFNIYRYGIKSVNFGNHDNQLDSQYGLQQVRLFGNRSYYGALKYYYRIDMNVEPKSLYSIVNFTSSNSTVVVENRQGYADVYLNNTNYSTREEISENVFTNGEVTLSACDDLGNVFCTYTFHVVNAVNVFDAAGYMNAGSDVVLQVNLGHNDEINAGKQDTVMFDNYINKETVYGNGYLINFAYKNEGTPDTGIADCNDTVVSINYAYNISIKGTNTSVGEDDRHNVLFDPREVKYCELAYMNKGVEALKGSMIKRCLFRTITFESIYLNYYVQDVYVEDIIIFDGGATAIELERKDLYIKGFLDIYNFQNKNKIVNILDDFSWASGLTYLADILLKGIVRDNPGYASEKEDGMVYTNICIVSTQKESPSQLYFYNESTSQYEYSTDGIASTAPGLKRINASSLLSTVGWPIYIWALPDSDGYPKWSDQYYDDGTVNYSNLAGKEVKLLRLNG